LGGASIPLLKLPCKVWPTPQPHPAFPQEQFHWAPLINVRLIYKHAPPTKSIECWVDSGAHACLFHASLCHSLGIRPVEDGVKEEFGGIFNDPKRPVYFHKVKIIVVSEQFETMAGFSWDLSAPGILGRRGFFQNFITKIDSSGNPPFIELQKIVSH
jgi:hypothetical protein